MYHCHRNVCRSKNSHNSVSLLPMPFVLNCMMVNELQSKACVGIDVGSDCGFGRVGVELHERHTQSLIMCSNAFEDQTTLNVPIQNNDCINYSSPHDL